LQSSSNRRILGTIFAAAFLSACGGSGSSSVPNAASPLGAAQSLFGRDASSVVFSGEYVGEFRTKGGTRSRLRLYLSQYQDALGGALISTKGSQGLAGVVSWVANGKTINGTAIGGGNSGGYCTYSVTGKYKYRRLTGTYTAMATCSGQTGTFNLWHKCYIPGTGSEAIRPEKGVKPC
jgi:hypothetical protein